MNTFLAPTLIPRTLEAMEAEIQLAAEHGYVVEFEDVEGCPDLLKPVWG